MADHGLKLMLNEQGNLDLDGSELLEHFLCNGWEYVDAILFSGLVLVSPDGQYYANEDYQVRDIVSTLLCGKKYTLYTI